MLYRSGNQWALCLFKVRYTQYGELFEQYTHDKQWWLEFVEQWEHTVIIEFIDVVATDEQLARLEEVNILNIPNGFNSICSDYVEYGIFPEGIEHKLRNLQLEKENKYLINENILKDNKIITLEGGVMELTIILSMMGGM